MCDIQALKSHFLCEVWWRGVPTGRPLGGAAAVKWCTVRPPADSLGLSAALSGKLQNCCCCFFFWSGWSPDFRCWSSWRRRVPPLTWTPRMSCARRAATPTACSASPWPCTGSYNQRIKHCERWTFFLLHDTTAWTVVMWSRRQESVGDGARRYFRDLSQA